MKKLIIASMLAAIASMSPVMAQNKPQAIIAVDAGPGMLKALEGVQFQGKFKSVDPKTRKEVIAGPEVLKGFKVGNQIEAIITQNIAVQVTASPAK